MTYVDFEANELIVFGQKGGRWLWTESFLPTYSISFGLWVSCGEFMGVGMEEIGPGGVCCVVLLFYRGLSGRERW